MCGMVTVEEREKMEEEKRREDGERTTYKVNIYL